MFSDPRSIAFITDCIQPQFRHDAASLQKLYARMMADRDLNYTNFQVVPGGAQMTTIHGPASLPGAGSSHSALSFGPDRLQVKEEWPHMSLDEYVTRTRSVVEIALDTLGAPGFAMIQCTVRCLSSIQGVTDSRQFFQDTFFRTDENGQQALGRPINLLGLRMVFPPSTEDNAVHNVRIESFGGDVQSVFLEECGVYNKPVSTKNLEDLEGAIRRSYEFLTRNVVSYLETRVSS